MHLVEKSPLETPEKNELSGMNPELFNYHFVLLKERPEILENRLFERIRKPGLNIRPELINKALYIAKDAHYDQIRKYTGDPYYIHPIRVALLSIELAEAMGEPVTEELIVGSLLHDTVEDSPIIAGNPKYTKETLRAEFEEFGMNIAERIADDSEAMSHNISIPRAGKLDSQQYSNKITSNNEIDQATIKRRKIIKTNDRRDNLLDPLTLHLPANITTDFTRRIDKLAIEFRGSRISYIKRSHEPDKLMHLLLADEPYLMNVLDISAAISHLTMIHPNLETGTWQDKLPVTVFQKLAR
ncbi:MAG TPA: HD domain-containing protein [Candidatus Sulfotelmatobacter sp.]|jgi:hypothetical protein|nr:HD domain-containing protein [Candidatus Sulfotelmatobacter sp.]